MNESTHLDTLKDIRTIMERSSRFLSLSGVSGIVIGLYGLVAATLSGMYIHRHGYEVTSYFQLAFKSNGDTNTPFLKYHIVLAAIMILASLITAWAFTRRAAKKQGLKSWDATAKRLAINLFLPLLAGGIFILALLQRLEISLIAPSMLLFYGLALLNASKYTFNDIRYLGILEILIGLLTAFVPAWGLLGWGFGFGVLHVLYGVMMYYKYRQ